MTSVVLCSGPAAAQVVTGRVIDDGSEEPVAGAALVLVDRMDRTGREVVSNETGRFVLSAEGTGRHRLRVQRLGYADVTTPEFDLLRGDTLAVEIRIAAEAIPLAPLTVTSERSPLVLDSRLARWGFYERQDFYGRWGSGYYIDHQDIWDRRPFRTTDLLRLAPRLRIFGAGGRLAEVRGPRGCRPRFYLDGVRLRLLDESIDEVMNAAAIVAIEVYTSSPAPVQYGGCSVVIWTGYHDAMGAERQRH